MRRDHLDSSTCDPFRPVPAVLPGIELPRGTWAADFYRSTVLLAIFSGALFLSALPAISQESHALMAEAKALMDSGAFAEGIDRIAEAVELSPEDEEIQKAAPVMLNNCGVKLVEAGDLDAATGAFRKSLEIVPGNRRILANLGDALEKKGEYGAAADIYSSAASAAEEAGEVPAEEWLRLGMLRFKQKDPADAIYFLDQVLDKDPGNVNALFMKARAEYDAGETEEAIEIMKRARSSASDEGSIKDIDSWIKKFTQEQAVEGDFVKDQTNHFIIKFDTEKRSDVIGKILEICEEAYSEVGARLDFYPPVQTTVVVYDAGQYYDATGMPEWSGGAYDNGMIRLPINDARAGTDRTRKVVFHEYTHLIVNYLTKGRQVPQWLNEGLAEFTSQQTLSNKELAILRKAIAAKVFVDLASIEGSFLGITDRDTVSLVYTTSYLAVKYLSTEFGRIDDLVAVLKALSEGREFRPVLAENLNASFDELRVKFKEWLIENYK